MALEKWHYPLNDCIPYKPHFFYDIWSANRQDFSQKNDMLHFDTKEVHLPLPNWNRKAHYPQVMVEWWEWGWALKSPNPYQDQVTDIASLEPRC